MIGRIEIKIGGAVVMSFDGRPEQRDAPVISGSLAQSVGRPCERLPRPAPKTGLSVLWCHGCAGPRPLRKYVLVGTRTVDPLPGGACSTVRAGGVRRGDGILLGSRAHL